MANHSESNIWGSVYRWEVTDPMLAGEGGIMNNPIAALVGRTGYLKNILDKTLFTRGFETINSNTTLSLGQQGKGLLLAGTTDFTLSLPAVEDGIVYHVTHASASNLVVGIAPISGTAIYDNGINVGALQIKPFVSVFVIGFNSAWWVIGNTKANEAGKIETFACFDTPIGYLRCDGQAVSRTKYKSLFDAIGTTYGFGDAFTTFNLPDLRGQFIRGGDYGAGVDAGRAFGSLQSDSIASHSHTINRVAYAGISGSGGKFVGTADSPDAGQGTTNAFGGSETRPKNVALQFCIKY